MRLKIINGKRYDCPKYLVRVIDGWQVRLPNIATLLFSDGVHGSTQKAFNQAKRYLEPHEVGQVERKDKKRPTGVPGIMLNSGIRPGHNIEEYRFQLSIPGVGLRTVYIGTTNTWEAKYEDKLAYAIKRKSELEEGRKMGAV